MLYTRKGDGGTTKTFGCDQRISKSSDIAEALGTLDEANSFLGLCKARAASEGIKTPDGIQIARLAHDIQKNLFIVQAEMAGAPNSIQEAKVKEVEDIVDAIERELPPIKSFFISGATELSALFDFARTLVRRAERRAVKVSESGERTVSQFTLAYLNRLSSLLYALARWANCAKGVREESPDYK